MNKPYINNYLKNSLSKTKLIDHINMTITIVPNNKTLMLKYTPFWL